MYEAVILAGGFGTRLNEITNGLPKPLMDINGEPLLFRLIKNLEAQNCRRIILSLHYCADQIINRINSEMTCNCEIDFIVEPEPLGTGGALKLAAVNVQSHFFLALNGDTFADIDFNQMIASYVPEMVLIGCTNVDDCKRYGKILIDDQGFIKKFEEKGSSGPGLINCGTYILPTEFMKSLPKKKFSLEENFFQKTNLILKSFITSERFIDIGIPEDYYFAQEYLK